VEAKYQNFQQSTAYATSFLLIFVSVACIIVVAFLRPKQSH
jgi:sulfate/thiosulfate transport system permease protein